MANLDERRIAEIVERVVARLGVDAPAAARVGVDAPAAARPEPPRPGNPGRPGRAPAYVPSAARKREANVPRGTRGVFSDADQAISAAQAAFEQYELAPLSLRHAVVAAMRKVTLDNVEALAVHANAETGLGRVEHKISKNTLAATKTPGPEILQPHAWSGDGGLTVVERAPYGVIGSVTPTTNPTETIINNGIGMVAGGNAVVFNTHPGAKKTCAWHVHLLNEAIVAVGGPENLLCCLAEPTIETAQYVMRARGIRLLVVTGGPGVVREAMNSGKKVIAGGPGNPPAVVDATAHVEKAAACIIQGGSIDNNILCTAEKEVIATTDIADLLKKELVRQGVVWLTDRQRDQLEKTLCPDGKHTTKELVGKNVRVILKTIGVNAPDSTLLAMCDATEDHPFVQTELLSPVLGMVRTKDVYEAIAMAKRVEHGFNHTAVMHSTNLDALHTMARTADCSIFVKNGSNLAGLGLGGEGHCSFTIASPTGEGLTTAINFTRERRCTLKDHFRIV